VGQFESARGRDSFPIHRIQPVRIERALVRKGDLSDK
jgi:hypothetical protein